MQFAADFEHALRQTPCSPYQIELINSRYITLVKSTWAHYWAYTVLACVAINFITIANIIVAALIGINSCDPMQMPSNHTAYNITAGDTICIQNNTIIWICWSLSLAAAIINKILYISNLTQNKIRYGRLLDDLQSEGFKYLSGTFGYNDSRDPFTTFCSNIETILADYPKPDLQFNAASNIVGMARRTSGESSLGASDEIDL